MENFFILLCTKFQCILSSFIKLNLLKLELITGIFLSLSNLIFFLPCMDRITSCLRDLYMIIIFNVYINTYILFLSWRDRLYSAITLRRFVLWLGLLDPSPLTTLCHGLIWLSSNLRRRKRNLFLYMHFVWTLRVCMKFRQSSLLVTREHLFLRTTVRHFSCLKLTWSRCNFAIGINYGPFGCFDSLVIAFRTK